MAAALRVRLLGLVQRSLRLVDRLLTACTVLLHGGLFFRLFKLAALLFLLVVESGLSLRSSLVDGTGGGFSAYGLAACGRLFVGLLPS